MASSLYDTTCINGELCSQIVFSGSVPASMH